MLTSSKSKILVALTTSIVSSNDLVYSEPTYIYKAMRYPNWVNAVKEELIALAINNTWSLIPLPGGRIPTGCKWLLKIKHNSDGYIVWHKAWLMTKGFLQKARFDFHDTFSPIVKVPTVRIILTLALRTNGFFNMLMSTMPYGMVSSVKIYSWLKLLDLNDVTSLAKF